MFFPSDLKDIVGFLCGQLPGDEGIVEPEPKGTGFFLDASPVRQGHIYLVTARHVVRDLQRAGPTFLRVSKGYPNQRGAGLNYLPLANEGWLYHQDPNVDVAVYSLESSPSNLLKFAITPPDNFAVKTLDVEIIAATPRPLGEGEDVYFVGLMHQIAGEKRNLSVVRKGAVSLIPDEKITGEYGPSDYYVIQAQAYKGNSGAPVWIAIGQALTLIGVLTFAYPSIEELRIVKGYNEYYYNLGMSLVAPIEKAVEIINSDSERDRRSRPS